MKICGFISNHTRSRGRVPTNDIAFVILGVEFRGLIHDSYSVMINYHTVYTVFDNFVGNLAYL